MGDSSSIEWTDATWNPTRGCSRVDDDGCKNCYAMRFAHRFSGPGQRYEGLTRIGKRGVDWSGKVQLVPGQLELPLRWRARRRIFVDSMSDLFHEGLPDEALDAVIAVMGACDDGGLGHEFQVLTKRPERALGYLKSERARKAWNSRRMNRSAWPARNLWLGVSVSNQKNADERIPLLLQCPAAVRFVSYEPAIGPVDFTQWLGSSSTIHLGASVDGMLRNGGFCLEHLEDDAGISLTRDEARRHLEDLRDRGVKVIRAGNECDDFDDQKGCRGHRKPGLDWIIVGGESGNGARPFNVDWARDTIKQCREAGVACFVKQLGAMPYEWRDESMPLDYLELADRKGGDWSEWPGDALRVREFPEVRV